MSGAAASCMPPIITSLIRTCSYRRPTLSRSISPSTGVGERGRIVPGEQPPKPPRKRAPRKAPAKKAPAKKAPAKRVAPKPSDADREIAGEQMGEVVSISRYAKSNPGRKGRPAGGDTGARAQEVRERRRAVVGYRRLGLTFQEVADQVVQQYKMPSYTKADAFNDAHALLDTLDLEAALASRVEDLATLMSLQRVVYADAQNGDLDAVKTMLSILDRRSRYLGHDAPTRLQITGRDGGPIEIDTSDPGAIYSAALEALDKYLPHVPPPQLPGSTGTSK